MLSASIHYQMECSTYLRSHEFWRTTKSAGCRRVPHVLFAETVVGNLDMPIQCQENIVELQISVNDPVLMEVLQSQAHLCSVEPRWDISEVT
jgi:hypothetical protein